MSDYTCFLSALQPASYRGVPFWVRSDKEEYGRRVKTHEYPRKNIPYNEDMGEAAQGFSIHGYVVGDDAYDQKEAIVLACRTQGNALLVLPAKTAFPAVCLKLTIQRSKDDQGIFELDFEFKADPSAGNPLAIPIFESLIGGLLSTAATVVNAVFYDTYSTENVLPVVVDNASTRVQQFAQQMIGVVGALGSDAVNASVVTSVTTALIGLSQNVAALVQPTSGQSDAVDLPTSIANVFSTLMTAQDPSPLLDGLQTMSSFTVLEPVDATGAAQYGARTPIVTYSQTGAQTITYTDPSASVVHAYTGSTTSPSTAQDLANAAAFNGIVRCYALIAYAQALAATTFTNRQDAIQARATLTDLFEQQMERTMSYDLAILLQNARNAVVTSINNQIVTIVPVVIVEAPISLPSLYWAGRLYNDATRALQLSDRNQVPTPAYMPRKFEALAS